MTEPFLDKFTPKQAFLMGVVLTLLSLGTLGFLWSLRDSIDSGPDPGARDVVTEAVDPVQESLGGPPTDGPAVRPVGEDDHVRGDPDAPVTVIEYSDFECPFCGEFHPTLQRLVAESDDVRWVYRHFPLPSLHPNAEMAAEASECAAEQGAFWAMADAMFESQGLGLSRSRLSILAEEVGLDASRFNECLDSGRYASKVQADAADAEAAGAAGTPFTVILAGGNRDRISGAVPLARISSTIESLRQ
jgi:protein-disulfide isomerase